MMQLQVALDRIPLPTAVKIAEAVAAHADWIEVGTSLIKAHGMRAIAEVVAVAGDTPVLADTKTADDAATEADMCHAAGARATTVLAVVSDATISVAAARASQLGMELMVDLLATTPERRAELLERHRGQPHLIWAAHVGKDDQAAGRTAALQFLPDPDHARMAVAGGLTLTDIGALRQIQPLLRLIVGSAITKTDHPELAARAFRSATKEPAQAEPNPVEQDT
jgi:3-hexulose-6-phosphate synthase